jgi:FkbM family methyltransferase
MMKPLFRKKTINQVEEDIIHLIREATVFPRYTHHTFTFRNIDIEVSDFISVAYQLQDYFADEALKFKAENDTPIIYDCGANVGIASLYFKKLFPKAIIKAYEPDPKIFKYLKKNLSTNCVNDVEIFNSAVWVNNNRIEFGSEGADAGSIYFDKNKILVKSIRLADELKKEHKIDLLKIDIEGAEVELLKDCENEIHKVNYLFVEYHSWIKQPQKLNELLNILSRKGFRYYIRSLGAVNKQIFIERSFPIGMDVQLNIYAVNEIKAFI